MSAGEQRTRILRAEFHADDETAEHLREALQATADALTNPTDENTTQLLEIAVLAMMEAAKCRVS